MSSTFIFALQGTLIDDEAVQGFILYYRLQKLRHTKGFFMNKRHSFRLPQYTVEIRASGDIFLCWQCRKKYMALPKYKISHKKVNIWRLFRIFLRGIKSLNSSEFKGLSKNYSTLFPLFEEVVLILRMNSKVFCMDFCTYRYRIIHSSRPILLLIIMKA